MLKENAARIRAEVGPDVVIVAATKTRTAEELAGLRDAGIVIAGENRAQEIAEKFGKVDAVFHMIGHLQTNKIKEIADKVACVQSVDSVRLMDGLERQCAALGRTLSVFFEINAGREPEKTGVFPEDLGPLLDRLPLCPHLTFDGIMAMVPADEPANNRPYYRAMRALFEDFQKTYGITTLSMGMSGDYREAVDCGSNMIRLGTALFGPRNPR